MADKDVNIHINTPGADQSKRNLDKVGKAGKQVGNDIASGGKKAAESTDKSTKKLSSMSGVLSTLKGQVAGMVTAWLGMEGVKKVVNYFIERLEKIKQLQEDIYQKSLTLGGIGQALEIQTGTTGQQGDWTKKAIGLQKAGGLENAQTAKDMMISMDIAFSGQGGIKNPKVMDIARELAPFVGANQMSGSEVGQLFEFAGTAGIAPNADAYKQYFAKLQTGFTSSKSKSFGSFMTGLQKGGTAYMGQGGSLDAAISAFASARSVVPNESFAATLLEQASRFSSGAYAKPRQAVEASQGVKWENINMDQRLNVLLGHIASLPESSRTQTMIEQGFEPGLATEIQKMVTPEAIATMRSTRRSVGQATSQLTDQQMRAYLDSDLGKGMQTEAEKSALEFEAGPDFAAWQRRIGKAKSQHDVNLAKGLDDKGIWDRLEPYANAIKEMEKEAWQMQKTFSESSDEFEKAKKLKLQLNMTYSQLTELPGHFYPKARANQKGYEYEQQLGELQQSLDPSSVSNTTNINYINNTIYTPRVGPNSRGPRFNQE